MEITLGHTYRWHATTETESYVGGGIDVSITIFALML